MVQILNKIGLRARLMLLVVFTVIPAFALISYTAINQRKEAAAIAEKDAMTLVRQAAKEQRRLIESTRQLLVGLSKLPELKQPDATTCNKTITDIFKVLPLYRNVGIAALDGTVLCRTFPSSARVNISDRAYFQRAVQTRDFGVGDYQIGRATGLNSVNFGQAVLDVNGNVRAVVYAALNLGWLNELIAANPLPSGSTLIVVDSRGTVLAHHPEAEKWVGKSVQDLPIVKFIFSHPGEGTTAAKNLDGVPYLYAFAPLHDSPNSRVYVTVGIPKTVAFATADEGFVRNMILLLLVATLASIAAWVGSDAFVLRRIKAFGAAASRLGAGELAVRTGLPHGKDELGQLAATFDGMAGALQQLNEDLEDRVALRTRQLEEAYQAEKLRTLLDPLTGLPNRLLFNDRLSQALVRTEQTNNVLAVMLVDIDDFKEINDSYGHTVGDTVLKTVGSRLRTAAPIDATVARLGGDDFALAISAPSPTQALKMVDSIYASAVTPIDTGIRLREIHASAGVAFYPEHGRSQQELLDRADIAMHTAKRENGGLRVYAPGADPDVQSRLSLIDDVHDALANGEITLYYQPKFDYTTNEIVGVVGLARWAHPRQGVLKPHVFLPLVNDHGLMKVLTQRFINDALKQIVEWQKQGISLPISVIVDDESLTDPEFARHVRDLLNKHYVAAEMLKLGIEESALVLNPTRVRETLSELRRIGIAVTVENFGSGYGGSTGWINNAISSVADVKIGRQYILDTPNNENYFPYIQALIDVAHALKLKIGANGVETEAAWAELKTLGCDYAIGYFLSRPVPADEFVEWYRRSKSV